MNYIKAKIQVSEDLRDNLISDLIYRFRVQTLEKHGDNELVAQFYTSDYYNNLDEILEYNDYSTYYITTIELDELENVEPYKNIVNICNDCGAYIYESDDEIETTAGDIICQRCYENNYFTCPDCNEVVSLDYSIERPNGDIICQQCFDEYYLYCNHCDEVIHRDDAIEYDGDLYCQQCYDELIDENDDEYNDGLLQSYHDHSRTYSNILSTSESDNFLETIGFELETERGDSATTRENYCNIINNKINKPTKHVHFETDGSLECGVEIISEPMTLEYWNSQKDNIYKTLLETCRQEGYRSHNGGRCGLHIHFSKTFFGANILEQQQKINTMLLFFEIPSLFLIFKK